VDVIVYGDVVSDDPELTLPHPRAWERAFVLAPWLDADPEAEIPGQGRVAELLEAARVDGAGAWRGFRRITFPLLKPIFLVLALLSVIWDFNVFTQTYLLTGGLGNRDEFNLSLYLYDKAFTFPPSYGLGGALALILTVVLLIITVGYVRASVRQGALT